MSSDTSSKTHPIELPPIDKTGVYVDYWCSTVVQAYLANPESRKWQVVEVERYKKRSRNQHEYMVASLEHPTHENVNLRIERSREHVDAEGKPILTDAQKSQETPSSNSEDRTPPPPSGLWVQSSGAVQGRQPVQPVAPPKPKGEFAVMTSVSDSMNKSGNAYDVAKLQSPGPNDIKLETLSLKNNPLPLVHLAILATTVHNKASLYNLFEAQCFWYADMIVRVLAKQRNQSDQLTERPEEELCYSPRSGMFHIIRVHRARPAVVQEIENAFNERWEVFLKQEREKLEEEHRIHSQEHRIHSQGSAIEDLTRQVAARDNEVEAWKKRYEELAQSRQGGSNLI